MCFHFLHNTSQNVFLKLTPPETTLVFLLCAFLLCTMDAQKSNSCSPDSVIYLLFKSFLKSAFTLLVTSHTRGGGWLDRMYQQLVEIYVIVKN